MGDHRLRPFHGGAQQRSRLPHQRGAEANGLGRIQPVANAARGDERHVRAGLVHIHEAARRGDAPVAEDFAEGLQPALGAGTLDRRPAGAAGTRHIDRGNAQARQAARDVRRDAAAHLLHDDGHAQASRQLLDGGGNAAPVMVAPGLQHLLQRVEMKDEGIGAQLVHRAAGVFQPHAVDELHRAQIAVDRDVGGNAAQLRAQPVAVAGGERNPLRADPHGKAHGLRGFRDGAVDARGHVWPARHRGGEERQPEALAEEFRREVHPRMVHLRQGIVLEVDRVKAGGRGMPRHAGNDDVDVVTLAAADVAHVPPA